MAAAAGGAGDEGGGGGGGEDLVERQGAGEEGEEDGDYEDRAISNVAAIKADAPRVISLLLFLFKLLSISGTDHSNTNP